MDQLQRRFARDAVGRQPVAALERLDGFNRAVAVVAVDSAGVIAEIFELLLQRRHALAGRAALERGFGRRGSAGFGRAQPDAGDAQPVIIDGDGVAADGERRCGVGVCGDGRLLDYGSRRGS